MGQLLHVVDAHLSETEWQSEVMDIAKLNGWWCYHPFDSRRSEKGYPDLTLIRTGELLLVELKTMTGKRSPEQVTVGQLIQSVGPPVEYHLWRPNDREFVKARLARRR